MAAALKRAYLAVYNWAVFSGWFAPSFPHPIPDPIVHGLTVRLIRVSLSAGLRCSTTPSPRCSGRATRTCTPLSRGRSSSRRTAAVLEIIHGLVGLVRSPISATLPQIGSRLFVTWGILWSFPETTTHILVSSLVISWSITEIIRYSFFGTKELLGSAPSWLQWLRSLDIHSSALKNFSDLPHHGFNGLGKATLRCYQA
ncbi:hypothetical protein ACQ4PT_065283 [Festuca glaucescens]